MNLAALTRILAFVVLGALFITDYMFNMWAKEVPRETYILISSVALGVDIQFLRDVLVNAITKTLGGKKEE